MAAARSSWSWTACSRTSTATSRPVPTSATRPSPGTRRGSAPGCIIFVKLWQFDPDDRIQVRLDTNALTFQPAPSRPGVEMASLFQAPGEDVRLERWAPAAEIAFAPQGGLELLVLDGGFSEGGETFALQSWLRLPAGAALRAEAGPAGCRLWVKEGHLAGSGRVG